MRNREREREREEKENKKDMKKCFVQEIMTETEHVLD